MSKSSLIVGLFLVVAGLLFAVLLINSGNWDIALIAGLPPVALGSWIAVADKLGAPEPKEAAKADDETADPAKVAAKAIAPEKKR